MTSRRHLVASCLIVMALLTSPALHADARDSYKRGLDAIAKKQWDEAVNQMRLAIAEKPEATGMSIGTLFRRYTPHYFLGVALAEQLDCKPAVEAFDIAETQGKLTKEEARDLVQRRQACQKRLQRGEESVTHARAQVDAAAALAFQLAGVEGSPVMRSIWREGSPSFASRQEPATAQLANARSLLARAEQDLDPDRAEEAGRAAVQARKDLETLLAEASARRDTLQAEAQRELAALGKVVDETRRNVSFVTRSLAPVPPAIARLCERAEETLTRAAAADLGTPAADIRRLQEQLRVELRELRAAIKPPPDDLQRAAAAYLGADYETAISLLAPEKLTEPRAAAQGCLLRAASLYALAGATVPAAGLSRQRAREELERCVAMPNAVKPIPSAFPPGFLALYDEVAAAPRAPAP